MTKNQKILHDVNGIVVEQRVTDSFINGTAMCVAHGKDISDWLKTDETWELVTALAEDLRIEPVQSKNRKSGNSVFTRVSASYPSLVIVRRGSPENGGGTWLHPDLAIQLAQRCSGPFAIQVSRWIREWITTGQNPLQSQADIERLIYRSTLKDESRLRAAGQVKFYLVDIDQYDNKDVAKKLFVDFHDAINFAITGEPAWRMRNRLSKVLGRKVTQSELIRDYYPAIALQRYIALCEAAANLMIKHKWHPLTAVEEAASLVLPFGYTPTTIDFAEHINLVRLRVSALQVGQTSLNLLQN